jgi:hypothetical protein
MLQVLSIYAMQYEKEEKMMIAGIGRLLINGVFRNGEHDGIVRMFEVEYAKEYRIARKAGVHIDRHFVEEFLKTTK